VRLLSTVYVREYRARVSCHKGSLIVKEPDVTARVPVEGIDAVVLMGGQITAEALAECTRRGVRVASLQRSGRIKFVVGGPRSGNVHLRLAQYQAAMDERKCLEFDRIIVAAKLQNSARVLSRFRRDVHDSERAKRIGDRSQLIGERIARLAGAPDPDHVRGIEGDAARAYFAALGQMLADSPLHFSKRTRRPPRDPVNALLGFCYGLLVTELVGAIDAVGLDPQVGFFHRPRSGRPALALDLAEEFRPLVDRFVVGAVRRRQLGLDDFVTTPGGGVYMSDDGRTRLLKLWETHKNSTISHRVLDRTVERWALPGVQATLLARHLRGDLPTYAPFVLEW